MRQSELRKISGLIRGQTLIAVVAMLYSSVASFFFISILYAWLASCSERSCKSEDWMSIELNSQSLSCFTIYLRSGLNDPLAFEPYSRLAAGSIDQYLYFKYLFGSVAIFGWVDEGALNVLRNFSQSKGFKNLSNLLEELLKENSCDTVAKFIAKSMAAIEHDIRFVANIVQLINNLGIMKTLITKVMANLEDNKIRFSMCCMILRTLSAEEQYEMIQAVNIPPDVAVSAYYHEHITPSLRELFALARCSYNPNLQIRRCIAKEFPYFQQFLADDSIKVIASPCPDSIPALGGDTLYYISELTDIETLLFVWPLVCTSWLKLHPKILTHSKRIHDFYLQDLGQRCTWQKTRTFAPWKYCLLNNASAMKYLGRCIVDGALDRASATEYSEYNLLEFLSAVTRGKTPLPDFKDCIDQCGSFLRLFETIHEFCSDDQKPILDKPTFADDKAYEQMVRRLVCEKKWILGLSNSWIVNNMSRLFRIVEEDKVLMTELIHKNFEKHVASIILIQHGQTSDVTEELARLVFSRTSLFKGLVEPEVASPKEYYNFIVERDIFPVLIKDIYWSSGFIQFTSAFILFLRGNPNKIDRVVASMIGRYSDPNYSNLRYIGSRIRESLFKLLKDSTSYSSADAKFVDIITTRFQWTDKRVIT